MEVILEPCSVLKEIEGIIKKHEMRGDQIAEIRLTTSEAKKLGSECSRYTVSNDLINMSITGIIPENTKVFGVKVVNMPDYDDTKRN